MWILAPLLPAKKDNGSGDAAVPENQNSAWFLTSGRCTLGRPSQKGGTTGKADIIILGDSSVSSLHAFLDITPGSTPDEQPSVTITDHKSKFSTYLHGEKLPQNTPTPLADGQDLRLGYKSKFRLVWQAAPLLHCPHPLADPPAAAVSSLLAQAGALEAPWGPKATHVLAAEGQPLSAAVLCAAMQGVPVVGVSWLQALTSKTAWKAALPACEEHHVNKFTYLSSTGTQDNQQQQELDLAAWAAAGSGELLQGFSIVVDVGQAALLELCMLLGAQVSTTASTPQPSPSQLYIVSSGSSGSEQLQQHGQAASVPEQLLLTCVAQRDVAVLTQQLEQHAASIAAEEDHSETVATSEHGTGSGADDEDGAEVTGVLLPAHGTQRRAAAAAHAAAEAAAAVAAPAAETTPRGKQRRGAASTASPASATRGKSRKRQQPAAAAEAAATPPSKRRKGRSAGAAEEAAPMEAQPPPLEAAAIVAPANTTTATAAGGGGRSRHGSRAQPAATQQAAHGARAAAADGQGVIMVDLMAANLPADQHVAQPQQQQQQPAVVNFKAFRRKGQAPAPAAAGGLPVVVAVEPFSAEDTHPDTDLFLREEEQRRKRMQKAEELFNAAVGPSKSRAGAGTGARSSRR